MTMLSIIWFLSIDQVLKIDWKSEMEHVVPSRNVLYIKTLGWLCALGRSSWCTLQAPLISNIARHVNLISDYYQNKITRGKKKIESLLQVTLQCVGFFLRTFLIPQILNELWFRIMNWDFDNDRYGLTLILELPFILAAEI